MSILFPTGFLTLAVAHFLALLSPGQDFFLIISHAIRYRLTGSRFICLGIALGNGIYIMIALIGWHSIKEQQLLFSVIKWLGAGYLIWVGAQLLRSQPFDHKAIQSTQQQPTWQKQLILGLNSALLNPKNALFYMSLMTIILQGSVTSLQLIVVGTWLFCAVLIWDLFIAMSISHRLFQKHLNKNIHQVEKTSGVILIGLGLSLLIY